MLTDSKAQEEKQGDGVGAEAPIQVALLCWRLVHGVCLRNSVRIKSVAGVDNFLLCLAGATVACHVGAVGRGRMDPSHCSMSNHNTRCILSSKEFLHLKQIQNTFSMNLTSTYI